VPFKQHSKGRRHISRQRRRVTNCRDYDAALRNRGSFIVWFTEEARFFVRANFAFHRVGDSSTVEQRTLTPSILVRIQVPQPCTPYFQFPQSPEKS
jgi:hypothetical protein